MFKLCFTSEHRSCQVETQTNCTTYFVFLVNKDKTATVPVLFFLSFFLHSFYARKFWVKSRIFMCKVALPHSQSIIQTWACVNSSSLTQKKICVITCLSKNRVNRSYHQVCIPKLSRDDGHDLHEARNVNYIM